MIVLKFILAVVVLYVIVVIGVMVSKLAFHTVLWVQDTFDALIIKHNRKKRKEKHKEWAKHIASLHPEGKVIFKTSEIFIRIKNANKSGIDVKIGRHIKTEFERVDLWSSSIKCRLSIEDNLLLIGDTQYRLYGEYWVESPIS